eukprot:scaffold524296_cov19-Prasinocladus_malaysianus.AAC.1
MHVEKLRLINGAASFAWAVSQQSLVVYWRGAVDTPSECCMDGAKVLLANFTQIGSNGSGLAP